MDIFAGEKKRSLLLEPACSTDLRQTSVRSTWFRAKSVDGGINISHDVNTHLPDARFPIVLPPRFGRELGFAILPFYS